MAPALMTRIARFAAFVLELNDRIKGTARRLAPDAPPQTVADHSQGQSQRKNLRNALNRKRRFAVARRREVSFGVDYGEPEGIGVDPGEFGNIRRDFAPIRSPPHFVGYLPDDDVEVGQGGLMSSRLAPLPPWTRI